MAELAGEGSVVIAAHGDDLCALGQLGESFFDVGAFGFTGAWGVDEIADEDDSLR